MTESIIERPPEDICVVCRGYLQFQENQGVDEDGVCATCNGMLGEENKGVTR